tara:strand:- start:2993 stop:3784 length:792 start_codon:yes stop_codon:yes gene_type:complete
MNELDKIIKIIKILRDPIEGCPWDSKQTHNSLLPYLIEETYEVIEAINNKNDNNIKEELGDLLLQILLHSEIASEEKKYNIKEIINSLSDKMIRRHPHVFKNKKKLNEEQLTKQWNELKQLEGKKILKNNPYLSINSYLPIMLQTLEIGKISSNYKFDWKNYKGPSSKVKEELNEVIHEQEKKKNKYKKIEEEIGDLLFSVINLARHVKVNPELALIKSNKKFIKRFNLMLKNFENKQEFINTTSKEKEKLWHETKNKLKQSN